MATEVAMRLAEALLMGLPAWLALGAAWLCGWRLRDMAWLGDARWAASLALAAGTALGLALVAASPHAREFAPHRIFAPDAMWAASLGELLGREAWPGPVAAARLLARLPGDVPGALAVLVGLMLLAGLAGLWARNRGLPAGRGVAALALLVLAGALGAHLLVHLGAWGVRRLSFWTFLVLLLAFQQWRWHRRWARLGWALRGMPRSELAPG